MWRARFPSLVLPFFVLLVCADVSSGQSGRRPPRSSSSTPPNSETPKDSIKPGADKSHPKISVLIGRQPTSRRLLSEDTIYASFIQRLNEQRNIEAIAIGDLKKRDHAVKQARVETDRFVVLLQLEIDNFQEGTIVLNSPDLEVKYYVFAPRTGQQKFKGKVYYQAIGGARARKDAWPNGPPIRITPEAAAIAAADGLYDWFLLKAGIKER